jgi:hypothetical protein
MTRVAGCAGISMTDAPGRTPGTTRDQGARLSHIAAALRA